MNSDVFSPDFICKTLPSILSIFCFAGGAAAAALHPTRLSTGSSFELNLASKPGVSNSPTEDRSLLRIMAMVIIVIEFEKSKGNECEKE